MYYNPLLRVDSHLESELSFAPRIRTVFQGLCTIYFSQSPLTYETPVTGGVGETGLLQYDCTLFANTGF